MGTSAPMKRNAGIELFRCILMFLIVLYHCFNFGIFKDSQALWPALVTCLIVWHVDGFVAISGWFGVKFSWRKFWHLWAIFAFYSTLSIAYAFITGSLGIGAMVKNGVVVAGWFGGTYMMLMMVSPMINLALEQMVRLPRSEAWGMWGLFALAMTLTWAPLNLLTGVNASGAGPFSIATLVFVYVTARLVRLLQLSVTKRRIACGMVLFFGFILTVGVARSAFSIWRHQGVTWKFFESHSMYNAPHVWIMAIAMLLLFAHYVKVSELAGRIVRFLSPSMFGIYLCHITTSFGGKGIRGLETWIQTHVDLHPLAVIFLSAIGVWSVSLSIDLLRRGLFSCGGRLLTAVRCRQHC